MDLENRVIVLIDMDCFYCQVEEKLNPELKGKSIAVVQYNPWKGGGIIAVNYVARAMGVTRHMRGDEAKEKCPEIELPSVPCQRGKADITKYRDAGKEVAIVLQKFTPLLERASIDEAYLDITTSVQERMKALTTCSISKDMLPNTYALGYDDFNLFMDDVQNYSNECIDFDLEHSKRLLVGAVIVSEIRAAIYSETGYRCSAGIAHNKKLAKLVCGINKPNKQTILPKHSVNFLYRTLPVKKVQHLGGKFGDSVCEILKISKMCELQTYSEKELQAKFDEKNGTWLYNIARGIDLEPVQAKFNAKSIGCCKQFRGRSALTDLLSLKKWLKDLGDEIEDRLEKDALENNRTPKQMVVSFSVQLGANKDVGSSRSYNFSNEDELCGELYYSKALELIMDSTESMKPKDDEDNRKLKAPIKFLGISVGKFEDNSDNRKTKKILDFFTAGASKVNNKTNIAKECNSTDDKLKHNDNMIKGKTDKEYIIQKFFNSSENNKNTKGNNCQNNADMKGEFILNKETMIEANLHKQESFFARFLNNALNQNSNENAVIKKDNEVNNGQVRSITPLLNVVVNDNNSNDTDCSSSTINNEINKSMTLFDNDPDVTARVSNMRNLLGTSGKITEEHVEEDTNSNQQEKRESPVIPDIDTIVCPVCRETVPVNLFDTHSDYHMALNLRNEERELVRKEIREKNKEKESIVNDSKQLNTTSSITSFFVKFDESIPTEICIECKKKIPVEKLPEHQDFHEAQRLSRELNKKATFNLNTQNSVKRKRKNVSPIKKIKMPCRSIDSFFR